MELRIVSLELSLATISTLYIWFKVFLSFLYYSEELYINGKMDLKIYFLSFKILFKKYVTTLFLTREI